MEELKEKLPLALYGKRTCQFLKRSINSHRKAIYLGESVVGLEDSHAVKRVRSIDAKILRKYPELECYDIKKPHSFFDKVKAYHELEQAESQRRRDWVIIGLTLINLALVLFQLLKK